MPLPGPVRKATNEDVQSKARCRALRDVDRVSQADWGVCRPRPGEDEDRRTRQQRMDGKVNLKPTTRARYESALKVHVLPRWNSTPLGRVEHGDIQKWVAEMSAHRQSGASVRKAFGVLSSIMDLAVRTKRIPSNPAVGVHLPPMNEKRRRYLTAKQVEQLAIASAALPTERPRRRTDAGFEQYRLAVLVLAYCGLRAALVGASGPESGPRGSDAPTHRGCGGRDRDRWRHHRLGHAQVA
jgi:integrase